MASMALMEHILAAKMAGIPMLTRTDSVDSTGSLSSASSDIYKVLPSVLNLFIWTKCCDPGE
ncbi:hypothetical protein B566_EDAN010700 [Ephemera danica]|nr:hypothetical protein B566_EDAN010700 [Ephemera danica]